MFGEESQYDVDGVFECLPCAEGCESCEDDSPCVVSLNWLMRTAILILECCVIACLPAVALFTWKYGNVKEAGGNLGYEATSGKLPPLVVAVNLLHESPKDRIVSGGFTLVTASSGLLIRFPRRLSTSNVDNIELHVRSSFAR
ncbi:hypothetical protein K0M31_008290 [Melipona bicolor]|uniref:Uncharacterized protein n=1 Tax=Melipona bicolor TaxID=60889 RepID=A0AA40FRC3_9HYME|nr:hypothetical protein K0M31_008290 [Melipona bicolor]